MRHGTQRVGSWFLSGLAGLGMASLGCHTPPATVVQSPVTLGIQPSAVTMTSGRQMKFGYRISSSFGGKVAWRVLEPGGGTVDPAGNYQAPGTPGTYTVEVSSQADPGKTARARVRVVPAPEGTISAPATLQAGASGVKASVPIQPGATYSWSVTGGTINTGDTASTVTFTVGSGPALTLACRVTNEAGDSLASSLEVPLQKPVSLSLSQSEATLTAGRGMKLGYTLAGASNPDVVWSVGEPGGGTVDGSGNYAAPATPGTYTVRVASKADPTKVAQARIKVVPPPHGTIKGPDRVEAGASNLAASVTEQAGVAHVWKISGGRILGSAAGRSISFSAGPGPKITLSCTQTNEAGDSFTTSLIIPVVPKEEPKP